MQTSSDDWSPPGLLTAKTWLPALRWRRVFPGDSREVAVVRRFLAALLPECPARDDLASVTTELASNAIRHTASGHGGRFTVEVIHRGTTVRVAVGDGGAPSGPRLIDDPLLEYGRGLRMVHAMAEQHGTWGGEQGRLVWADIPWARDGTRLLDPWALAASHYQQGLVAGAGCSCRLGWCPAPGVSTGTGAA
jgi:serine/threonine-protein kinase RsbW